MSFQEIGLEYIHCFHLHHLTQFYLTAVVDDLRRVPISLALRCLSFDFVGSPVDESSEEFGTVQVY
jgi:exportin-7